jgi:hypothetical protein
VLRAAILTRKAVLDDAAGAKPNPRAFLAENHVTGIKRTNGTQTQKKNVLIDSAESPQKKKARRSGPLGICRNKIAFKDRNGRFLDISAENYV